MPRGLLPQLLVIAVLAAIARAATVAGLELYADEAYYWLWSLQPAVGYFDHPPMVAWLIGLSSAVIPGELGVRLPFFACGGLAVVFAGLTARELSDHPRAPVYGALLAAAAPMLHLTGALALPDAPVEAAYAAAVWLLARARGSRWALAGVAVGLALVSKYSAALLAPALVLLVVWDRELRRDLRTPWPWLGAAVAVLVFLPTLLWDADRGFASIRFQLEHGFRARASLRAFVEFVGAQVGAVGPVTLAAGIWALARARDSAWRRVAAATLIPIAVPIYSAMRGEPEVNWTAHAIPSLAAAAGAWLATRRRGAALVAASLALCAAGAGGFAYVQHSHRFAGTSAYTRFHGWREMARQLRAHAGELCSAVSPPCDPSDPFVFPANYRYAGEIAFYTGWRRIGPGIRRVSQLDLWNAGPEPGEAVLVVAEAPHTLQLFREVARARQAAPERTVRVTSHGKLVRSASVAVFGEFAGAKFAR